ETNVPIDGREVGAVPALERARKIVGLGADRGLGGRARQNRPMGGAVVEGRFGHPHLPLGYAPTDGALQDRAEGWAPARTPGGAAPERSRPRAQAWLDLRWRAPSRARPRPPWPPRSVLPPGH